jgi:hypothetical protein
MALLNGDRDRHKTAGSTAQRPVSALLGRAYVKQAASTWQRFQGTHPYP